MLSAHKILYHSSEREAKAKFGKLEDVSEKQIRKILALLKDKKHFKDFRRKNLEITKKKAMSYHILISHVRYPGMSIVGP